MSEIERLREELLARHNELRAKAEEIERLRGLLREALPVIPLFGEWKQSGGMLVRTENGLLARVREALSNVPLSD